ncbi:MAG TPA: hypothetical protein VIP05_28430, partial [Burkholderiaceae bacterium]
MQALEKDAVAAPALEAAWAAANQAEQAACRGHRAGRASLSDCLLARREQALARIARGDAAARQLADSARWYAAMGSPS